METTTTSGNTEGTLQPTSRSAPIIERAPLPIVELEGEFHVVSYVNSAFCRVLGKRRDELMGRPFAEIVPGGRECLPILDRVYATGEAATHAYETEDDANPAYWLYAIWPALDAKERPAGVIIQLTRAANFRRDAAEINGALLISGLHQHELTSQAEALNALLAKEIAERKLAQAALTEAYRRLGDQAGELDRLVAERTEKLRETVAELEGFSYSVAHDMRAPLRGMQGFSRILLADHSQHLAPEARGYLESIARSAARMDLLIVDVLNYTRTLKGEVALAPVDLHRLVQDMFAVYPDWQRPTANVQIEGSLPIVLGHEGFLTQCISNLMTNAVKFVPKGTMPQVRIWAEDGALPTEDPGHPDGGAVAEDGAAVSPVVRICFQDNGIGIAAKDRNRIFRMFDRINPAAHFEGTGIGLTIVRKAVQRMGGQVDFESKLGKGSTFWIELKRAPLEKSGALAG